MKPFLKYETMEGVILNCFIEEKKLQSLQNRSEFEIARPIVVAVLNTCYFIVAE
jgi:hypothetical protein